MTTQFKAILHTLKIKKMSSKINLKEPLTWRISTVKKDRMRDKEVNQRVVKRHNLMFSLNNLGKPKRTRPLATQELSRRSDKRSMTSMDLIIPMTEKKASRTSMLPVLMMKVMEMKSCIICMDSKEKLTSTAMSIIKSWTILMKRKKMILSRLKTKRKSSEKYINQQD
jgi:hypothetical protein